MHFYKYNQGTEPGKHEKPNIQHPSQFDTSQLNHPQLQDTQMYTFLINEIEEWNLLSKTKDFKMTIQNLRTQRTMYQLHQCLSTIFSDNSYMASSQLQKIYNWYNNTSPDYNRDVQLDLKGTFYSPRTVFSDFMTEADSSIQHNNSQSITFYANTNESILTRYSDFRQQTKQKNNNIFQFTFDQDPVIEEIDYQLMKNRQKDLQQFRQNKEMMNSMIEWNKQSQIIKQKITYKRNMLENKHVTNYHNPELKKSQRESLLNDNTLSHVVSQFQYKQNKFDRLQPSQSLRSDVNLTTNISKNIHPLKKIPADPTQQHLAQIKQQHRSMEKNTVKGFKQAYAHKIKFSEGTFGEVDSETSEYLPSDNVIQCPIKPMRYQSKETQGQLGLRISKEIKQRMQKYSLGQEQKPIIKSMTRPEKLQISTGFLTTRNSCLVENPYFIETNKKKRRS